MTSYISYTCWASHTCYVCRSMGGVRLHASQYGYNPVSACDSVSVHIQAENRNAALKQARKRLASLL